VKKSRKKLVLYRDTVRSLTPPALAEAAGARNTQTCTFVVSCPATCYGGGSCFTCNTCPTNCGQGTCFCTEGGC
jgi:hypothetical protein